MKQSYIALLMTETLILIAFLTEFLTQVKNKRTQFSKLGQTPFLILDSLFRENIGCFCSQARDLLLFRLEDRSRHLGTEVSES
ncbi:hypothetical protein L596_008105 [Steinernema carpocapsae]|uniref:Uncharacterized protein n=1 Tax=Steinernema carpocapsae TaxID=34508 RepID=A0A4V6A671_STECR|nr:hypothetical protein L596_008105 [Steinernema carpocapsae]